MDTHSRIQELANNSEKENSRNKSHAKISKFTVGQGHHKVMIYIHIVLLFVKDFEGFLIYTGMGAILVM